MRLSAVLQALVLLLLTACDSTSPSCGLAGNWAWQLNGNPSGSDLNLTLGTANYSVTGTGLAHGIGPMHTPDTIAIAGHVVPNSVTFDLALSYSSGRMVSYAGVLLCPDTLDVTATEGASSYAIVFVRQ